MFYKKNRVCAKLVGIGTC